MVSRPDRGRGGWLIVVVVLVLVAAAATVGVIVVKGGSSSAGASVLLEPAGSIGTDPFTASVAIGPAVEFPGNVRAITVAMRKKLPSDSTTHTLVAAGTAPGLYGGSGDKHVCNPQQLVTFLTQHPDKAAAWASVLGMAPNNIGAYVGSLTPVVLTSDTLVTNHGFHNGHATTLQSVLQAGTAVMVDATGTPRVKCNCGNPLTPPALITPTHYRGTAWPGYTPTQVTVVNGGTTTVNITVINITTGDNYNQPVGGASGGEFVAAAIGLGNETTISTSPNGTTWSTAGVVPTAMKGLAWANGKWLALEPNHTAGTTVVESTDLHTWNAVASVPDDLVDVAYGNGRWIAVGKVAVQSTSADPMAGEFPPAAVYASSDAHAWTRVASLASAPPFTSVAYADSSWIAVGNGIHQGGEPSMTYRSTDGTTWTRQDDTGLGSSEAQGQLAYGSGQWALGGLDISPNSFAPGATLPSGVISLSPEAVNWTIAPGGHFAGNQIFGIAYGGGEWLAAAQDGNVFSSSDGKTWSRRGHLGAPADLAFGGNTASSPGPPASTTTTTTQASSSLASIDWKNYTYKDVVCSTNKAVRFTNGSWTDPADPNCGIAFASVDFADVTGDGVADAIVNLDGNASGVIEGASSWTTVFTADSGGPLNHGYISGASFPPDLSRGGIVTWNRHYGANDFMCCPSQYEKDAYQYSSRTGKFAKIGSTLVPAGDLPKR